MTNLGYNSATGPMLISRYCAKPRSRCSVVSRWLPAPTCAPPQFNIQPRGLPTCFSSSLKLLNRCRSRRPTQNNNLVGYQISVLCTGVRFMRVMRVWVSKLGWVRELRVLRLGGCSETRVGAVIGNGNWGVWGIIWSVSSEPLKLGPLGIKAVTQACYHPSDAHLSNASYQISPLSGLSSFVQAMSVTAQVERSESYLITDSFFFPADGTNGCPASIPVRHHTMTTLCLPSRVHIFLIHHVLTVSPSNEESRVQRKS